MCTLVQFILFAVLVSESSVLASKILFLTSLSTKSENEMFYPIINELDKRGHEITFVTSDPASSKRIQSKNVTHIRPFLYTEMLAGYDKAAFTPNGLMDWLFLDKTPFLKFCYTTFENEQFKEKVLRSKFDMVLINVYFGQCFYGLAAKDQASLVLLQTFPMSNYLLRDLGSYAPSSIVPYSPGSTGDHMNFWERSIHFVADCVSHYVHEMIDVPPTEAVYRKYLGQHSPGIREIHRNTSLVLVNTDPLVTPMRPFMPDVVEVGGISCREPQPLPKDIEDFISGAEHGFIYFSLGTVASTDGMPKYIHDKLMRVFQKLKQRVIWKYESEPEGVIRSNVFLRSFFPQQDILGHKNIRLFISHGGTFGTFEAVCHGVPLLGMPLIFDQFANIANAVRKGYALQVDLKHIDETLLEDEINKLLHNPRFKKRVTEMSQYFHTRLNKPVETAVFHIERVLKFKNSLEYRSSSARQLNFLQFHSLDTIGFLLILVVMTTCILAVLVKFMFTKCKHLFFSSIKANVGNNKKKVK